MVSFTINDNNIINVRCIKMMRSILILLILLTNITTQQPNTSNFVYKLPHTISVLNPAVIPTQIQPGNSTLSILIGYSPFSFHYYTSNETMIYREKDELWIYAKIDQAQLLTRNNTVLIKLLNPFNDTVLNSLLTINKPTNVYNFSDTDPMGYWLLKILYHAPFINNIKEFNVKIFLVNSKQDIMLSSLNQSLTIKQGALTYIINGTLMFKQPITEIQALLFPVDRPINTTITSIHGERIRIIGVANKILIDAESLLQFGIEASLKIQRPISIPNIISYQTPTYVYWYPLLYVARNTTPSTHHKITLSLDQLVINNEPIVLTISLLDPRSQQEYDTRSFNLIYLPFIGIYSYNNDEHVYSEPTNKIVFQASYDGYVHTKYVLAILSKAFELLYLNKVIISPLFVKINIIDQSMHYISNYQLTIINSSVNINTIFYYGETYIIPLYNSSMINIYYNIVIQDHNVNVNYDNPKMLIVSPGDTITLKIILYTVSINLYAWGKLINNPTGIKLQINKINDGGGAFFIESPTNILKLPPGLYNMKIFIGNTLNWSENVTLDSDIRFNIELYSENPLVTVFIVIVGTIIIISEILVGIRLIRKITSH